MPMPMVTECLWASFERGVGDLSKLSQPLRKKAHLVREHVSRPWAAVQSSCDRLGTVIRTRIAGLIR